MLNSHLYDIAIQMKSIFAVFGIQIEMYGIADQGGAV